MNEGKSADAVLQKGIIRGRKRMLGFGDAKKCNAEEKVDGIKTNNGKAYQALLFRNKWVFSSNSSEALI